MSRLRKKRRDNARRVAFRESIETLLAANHIPLKTPEQAEKLASQIRDAASSAQVVFAAHPESGSPLCYGATKRLLMADF